MGLLRLLRPWRFSHEARRGPQGASRAAPGKSGLHAHGEGVLVITLESWETARSSRGVEEGLLRSFSGCGRIPCVPSTCASDLRELLRVPLRSQGHCGFGRGLSLLNCVWCNRRGPHLEWRQEPQGSSPFLTRVADTCRVWTRESRLVFCGGMDLRLPFELFTE